MTDPCNKVGPPGSGKSHTDAYLRFVASATKLFQYASFHIDSFISLEDLVRSIHELFGWRYEEYRAEPTEPTRRKILGYVDILIQRVRRSKGMTLLFMDAEWPGIQPDVQELVAMLCRRLVQDSHGSLALILSGFQIDVAPGITRDILSDLSFADIEHAIKELSPSEFGLYEQLSSKLRAIYPGTMGHFNAAVNREFSALLPHLVRHATPVRVFISYSHKDEKFRRQLETVLAPLIRNGTIESWSDREISPGVEWAKEIEERLEKADIILLLVSPDYLASDYTYEVEMRRAIERAREGQARIIPIIVRPSAWQGTGLAEFQVFPRTGTSIMMSKRTNKYLADLAGTIQGMADEIRVRV
jgi:hypothetical protein